MTAPGAGLPSKAPTTGQPSGPRPAGPPEWLSSSHVRALHSCIVYDARDRNHPAISSGVTSCKAEANAAQTAYRRRRPSLRPPAIPSSRAAIASQAVSGATSSPSLCQTEVRPVPTAPSHPSANHDERFAATFALAWRDGLSRFRTCLCASVGSTDAAKDVVAPSVGSTEATTDQSTSVSSDRTRKRKERRLAGPHKARCSSVDGSV